MVCFKLSLILAFAVALPEGAMAQQPPDVVVSDANGNTAMGSSALINNTTGAINTAAGSGALISNSTGVNNTAFGYLALGNNSSGGENTAVGVESLTANQTGNNNTALGLETLWANTTGGNNTATGFQSLLFNTTGNDSTALGFQTLLNNSTGAANTASGTSSLMSNTVGNNNTANGFQSLFSNTSGNQNLALGYQAGYNLTSGSNNISIANAGAASDSGVVRVGTVGKQTAVFVAGILGSRVTGSAVYINSNGRLGVMASSERYKTDVATMTDNTDRLGQLRPVTFRLQDDPSATVQYGLIAEEVAKVYPELVIRGEDQSVEEVRYEELAPILLKEIQVQRAGLEAEARIVAAQAQELQRMELALAALEQVKDQVATRAAAQPTRKLDSVKVGRADRL